MPRKGLGFALTLLLGCASTPALVRVERAGPIDPESVRFAIHADGTVQFEGHPISTADMAGRTAPPSNERNLIPVLLEPDPEASFVVVRDVLKTLIGRSSCVNLAFRVDTPKGEGALVLPVLSEMCGRWRINTGRSFVQMTDETRLEIVVSAAAGGALQVNALKVGVPGTIYFPAEGEKAPDPTWKGAHPPFEIWDLDLLKRFLARSEVAALSPYVLFEIRGSEKVADVIQGLGRLGLATTGEIVPSILTGD